MIKAKNCFKLHGRTILEKLLYFLKVLSSPTLRLKKHTVSLCDGSLRIIVTILEGIREQLRENFVLVKTTSRCIGRQQLPFSLAISRDVVPKSLYCLLDLYAWNVAFLVYDPKTNARRVFDGWESAKKSLVGQGCIIPFNTTLTVATCMMSQFLDDENRSHSVYYGKSKRKANAYIWVGDAKLVENPARFSFSDAEIRKYFVDLITYPIKDLRNLWSVYRLSKEPVKCAKGVKTVTSAGEFAITMYNKHAAKKAATLLEDWVNRKEWCLVLDSHGYIMVYGKHDPKYFDGTYLSLQGRRYDLQALLNFVNAKQDYSPSLI